MRDFLNSLNEDMVKEIPLEYAEYLQAPQKELEFHDPQNEEQAAIAAKMKRKTVLLLTLGDIILLFILIYVIATQNKLIVIFLMGVLVLMFMTETIRVLRKKLQVATGRAVVKMKKRKQDSKRIYSYYVSVAVDEPEKAIYSRISVSREDFEKIQEGTPILIVNISDPGKGVVLN